jgi:hypothetical protein
MWSPTREALAGMIVRERWFGHWPNVPDVVWLGGIIGRMLSAAMAGGARPLRNVARSIS